MNTSFSTSKGYAQHLAWYISSCTLLFRMWMRPQLNRLRSLVISPFVYQQLFAVLHSMPLLMHSTATQTTTHKKMPSHCDCCHFFYVIRNDVNRFAWRLCCYISCSFYFESPPGVSHGIFLTFMQIDTHYLTHGSFCPSRVGCLGKCRKNINKTKTYQQDPSNFYFSPHSRSPGKIHRQRITTALALAFRHCCHFALIARINLVFRPFRVFDRNVHRFFLKELSLFDQHFGNSVGRIS